LKVAGIDGICIPLMPLQIVESPGKNQAVELLVKAGLAVRLADKRGMASISIRCYTFLFPLLGDALYGQECRAFRLKTPEW